MIVATTVTFLASGMLLGLLIFSLLPDWVAPLAILLLFGATMLAARTKYLFRQRNR
jgi:hypothetical protein